METYTVTERPLPEEREMTINLYLNEDKLSENGISVIPDEKLLPNEKIRKDIGK